MLNGRRLLAYPGGSSSNGWEAMSLFLKYTGALEEGGPGVAAEFRITLFNQGDLERSIFRGGSGRAVSACVAGGGWWGGGLFSEWVGPRACVCVGGRGVGEGQMLCRDTCHWWLRNVSTVRNAQPYLTHLWQLACVLATGESCSALSCRGIPHFCKRPGQLG